MCNCGMTCPEILLTRSRVLKTLDTGTIASNTILLLEEHYTKETEHKPTVWYVLIIIY